MGLVSRGAKLRRDLALLGLARTVRVVEEGLHTHQVHHAFEVFFFTQRQLDGHDGASESRSSGFERALEARAVAVHLADDDRARQAVPFCELPGLLRLDFQSRHPVDQDQGGVRRHYRSFGLVKENVVPGRVHEIDLRLAPLGVGERGANREFALDFLFVVVGDRGSLIHLAEPVDHAGREKQRRDQLRLARVAVSDQRDVADGSPVVDFHPKLLRMAESPRFDRPRAEGARPGRPPADNFRDERNPHPNIGSDRPSITVRVPGAY